MFVRLVFYLRQTHGYPDSSPGENRALPVGEELGSYMIQPRKAHLSWSLPVSAHFQILEQKLPSFLATVREFQEQPWSKYRSSGDWLLN